MTVLEPNRTADTGHAVVAQVSAQDAAARVGVSERTIRRAIARGDLPAVKQHGVFNIDAAALDAWFERRSSIAPPAAGHARAARRVAPLPEPATSLIGRERELTTAATMLRRAEVRLLTLTGAGGIGKTRLSLEIARQLGAEFANGVQVVPLARVADAGLVATTIAEHLGLLEPGTADVQAALVAVLRDRHTLLVLDNFEHVLAAAPLVSALLQGCPSLKILVTSRSLLHIAGEHALPVPPLALPGVAVGTSTEQAEASPAVRLFADRARAVRPWFALTPANIAAVTAICHRLGGLPLAIELAASQVTVLPSDALLARIEAHLPLPVAGPRDVPDRQRTMTNTIAWSYDLLPPVERRLFRRIGVFVGGFSLDAVEVASSPPDHAHPRHDPLSLLAALVDASLVQRARDADGRFAMLEPIRAYALGRLTAAGEMDATLDALVDWCLMLVERNPLGANMPGAERYLSRLGTEYANILRALEWVYQRRDGDRLLRLVVALGGYWYERNHYRDGCMWMERALTVGEDADASLRASAMVQYGLFICLLGDACRAAPIVDEGIAVLREADDAGALALALIWKGVVELHRGTYDRARQVFGEALALAATIPDASLAAAVSSRARSNLGTAAHVLGDLDAAARWHGEALAACREHGYLIGAARALCSLADVDRDRGDYTASLASYREALGMLGERSDLRFVVAALNGTAVATASWGQPERAARLLGAATGLAETFSVPIVMASERVVNERVTRAVREALDDARFDELFASGRRFSPAEAIAEVLTPLPPSEHDPAPHAAAAPLSPREREVLRLLAAGLRNREIAEALFVSRRTVESHVARIFAKLEVSTRVEAAHAAIELGPDR